MGEHVQLQLLGLKQLDITLNYRVETIGHNTQLQGWNNWTYLAGISFCLMWYNHLHEEKGKFRGNLALVSEGTNTGIYVADSISSYWSYMLLSSYQRLAYKDRVDYMYEIDNITSRFVTYIHKQQSNLLGWISTLATQKYVSLPNKT